MGSHTLGLALWVGLSLLCGVASQEDASNQSTAIAEAEGNATTPTVKAAASNASAVQEVEEDSLPTFPAATYDKFRVPASAGPVSVTVGMEVVQFYRVDEQEGSTEMDLMLTMSWADKGLRWDVRGTGQLQRRVEDPKGTIWLPGIDIVNQMFPYNVTKESAVVKGDTGMVEYKRRVLVAVATELDFAMYPFDKHEVTLEIESFFYSADEVVFSADEENCKLHKGVSSPRFDLGKFACSTTQPSADDTELGKSRYSAAIPLARKSNGHITMVIIPVALITLVSFSQFYMDLERLETRSFISTAAFLAVMVFAEVINANLPPVNYLTYLHYFTTICLMFTFLTIVEQTAMHYMQVNRIMSKAIPKIDMYMRMSLPPFVAVMTLVFVLYGKFS